MTDTENPMPTGNAAEILPGEGVVVHRRPLTVVVSVAGGVDNVAPVVALLVDELVEREDCDFAAVAEALQRFVVAHQPMGVAAVLDAGPDPIGFLFDQAEVSDGETTHRGEGRLGWNTVFVVGDQATVMSGIEEEFYRNPTGGWFRISAGTVPGCGARITLTRGEGAPDPDDGALSAAPAPAPPIEPDPQADQRAKRSTALFESEPAAGDVAGPASDIGAASPSEPAAEAEDESESDPSWIPGAAVMAAGAATVLNQDEPATEDGLSAGRATDCSGGDNTEPEIGSVTGGVLPPDSDGFDHEQSESVLEGEGTDTAVGNTATGDGGAEDSAESSDAGPEVTALDDTAPDDTAPVDESAPTEPAELDDEDTAEETVDSTEVVDGTDQTDGETDRTADNLAPPDQEVEPADPLLSNNGTEETDGPETGSEETESETAADTSMGGGLVDLPSIDDLLPSADVSDTGGVEPSGGSLFDEAKDLGAAASEPLLEFGMATGGDGADGERDRLATAAEDSQIGQAGADPAFLEPEPVQLPPPPLGDVDLFGAPRTPIEADVPLEDLPPPPEQPVEAPGELPPPPAPFPEVRPTPIPAQIGFDNEPAGPESGDRFGQPPPPPANPSEAADGPLFDMPPPSGPAIDLPPPVGSPNLDLPPPPPLATSPLPGPQVEIDVDATDDEESTDEGPADAPLVDLPPPPAGAAPLDLSPPPPIPNDDNGPLDHLPDGTGLPDSDLLERATETVVFEPGTEDELPENS